MLQWNEISTEGVLKLHNEAKSQIPQEVTMKRTLHNQRSKDNPILTKLMLMGLIGE